MKGEASEIFNLATFTLAKVINLPNVTTVTGSANEEGNVELSLSEIESTQELYTISGFVSEVEGMSE